LIPLIPLIRWSDFITVCGRFQAKKP
jgi:hypothetical protein